MKLMIKGRHVSVSAKQLKPIRMFFIKDIYSITFRPNHPLTTCACNSEWGNTLYTPVYMLDNPIVPAADPRKVLAKFGGPLTIEEYRQTLRSGKQLQALPHPVIKNISEIHLVTPKSDVGKILKGRRRLVSKPLNT